MNSGEVGVEIYRCMDTGLMNLLWNNFLNVGPLRLKYD